MKQTLILDGVIERLPQLIGDGVSTFSVQDCMDENFKRIGKAIVGNSGTGKVMAGLGVEVVSSVLTLQPGYGFTRAGDLIKISSIWSLSNDPLIMAAVPGTVLYIYLNYYELYRGDTVGTATDGLVITDDGHSSYINRENIQKPIIKDVVGGESGDSSIPALLEASTHPVSVSATLSMTDNKLYLGSVQFGEGDANVFTPGSIGSEQVEYVINHQFTAQLWSSSGSSTLNSIASTSRMILPSGRKRLRQINMLRLSPFTSSLPRTDTNYLIQMTPQQRQTSYAPTGTASAITLQDSVGAYFYESFAPNLILEDSCVFLELGVSVSSAAFATNTDANTNGIINVEYIIEKLN